VARHRVILSGTPIQNSVLELWTLFDFLMPGFLGSERAFSQRYARLVAASRDAGKGSREAAAGLVALDALHKQARPLAATLLAPRTPPTDLTSSAPLQVLPFILRRTKDQVLSDLPPKIIQDVLCEPTPFQAVLLAAALASAASPDLQALLSAADAPAAAASPLAGTHLGSLQRLFKICSHPRLALDWGDAAHVAAVKAHLSPAAARSEGAAMAELLALEHAPKLAALRQLLQGCGVLEDDAAGDATAEARS